MCVQVACGLFHSVALSCVGDVYMWAEEGAPYLVDFFAGRAVADVAAGQTRTFAVTEVRTRVCVCVCVSFTFLYGLCAAQCLC